MHEQIERIADLLGISTCELANYIEERGVRNAVIESICFMEDDHYYTALDFGIEAMSEEEALDPEVVAAWIMEVQFWGRRYMIAQVMIDEAFKG